MVFVLDDIVCLIQQHFGPKLAVFTILRTLKTSRGRQCVSNRLEIVQKKIVAIQE